MEVVKKECERRIALFKKRFLKLRAWGKRQFRNATKSESIFDPFTVTSKVASAFKTLSIETGVSVYTKNRFWLVDGISNCSIWDIWDNYQNFHYVVTLEQDIS